MLLLERDMIVVDLQTPTVSAADRPDVPYRRLECDHSAPLPLQRRTSEMFQNDLFTIHSLSSPRIVLSIGTLCV